MPVETIVHVEVTRELIDKHGQDLDLPCGCPGYHALRAAHVPVEHVHYDFIDVGYRTINCPREFTDWQEDAVRHILDGGDPKDIEPIAFDIEIPD